MLDYIQFYPETLELVSHYAEAERCRLYEAMMRYAFTGALPEWPENAPEWYVWPALRQSVERAAHRIEINRANASGRKRTEAKASENERNAYTESESESDIKEDEEEDDEDIKRVRDAWYVSFGSKPTPALINRLLNAGVSVQLIEKAIRISAAKSPKRPADFVLAVLRDWKGERLTIDDVDEYLMINDAINGRIAFINRDDALDQLQQFRERKKAAS